MACDSRYPRRLRNLTEGGDSIYEERVNWYHRQLSLLKADIDSTLLSIREKETVDFHILERKAMSGLDSYENVSAEFIGFLKGTRTLESDNEISSHKLILDTVRSKVLSVLNYVKQQPQDSKSGIIKASSVTSVSSVKSLMSRKKAELEVLKTKQKYTKLQTELMKQKVELESKLSMLLVKQEEEVLQTELKMMEDGLDADYETASETETRRQRTLDYVHKHFDNCSHFDKYSHDTVKFVPPLDFQEIAPPPEFQDSFSPDFQHPGLSNNSNVLSVEERAPQVYDSSITHIQYNVPNTTVCTVTNSNSHNEPLYTTPHICAELNSGQFEDYPNTKQPVATPKKFSHSFSRVSDVTSVEHFNTASFTSPPILANDNTPNVHDQDNQTYSIRHDSESIVNGNNTHESTQLELCKLMTKMMARKDVVLTRLVKYNDSPMQFVSWKRTFKEVTQELGVTPAEEIDLLIRWLGPDSSRQADSIKAACAGDSVRGLYNIWDRLDTRYGSPELVEECLKRKLSNFPKLTNSTNDYKRLFELYDILCEINCVKNDSNYSRLFAQYDSCVGINQIVSHLPVNLQEKWSSEANKYKKHHDRVYPPFTFFIDFVYDMARWRTDPSLHCSEQVNKSIITRANHPTVRVATRKTGICDKDERVPPVCPIHGTNHDLNHCREFRRKTIVERMDLLKRHKLCFRCCSLKKHIRARCKEKVECFLCKSTHHPTALHESETVAKEKPDGIIGMGNHGGEKQGDISSTCTQICGIEGGIGKSCAKIVPVFMYPNGKQELSMKVYALIDDQSNHSLAIPSFLDKFNEDGDRINYVLSSCAGKVSSVGRKTDAYTVEALDHSVSINIPALIECSDIPNNRDEIPSPEVATYYPHLNDLVVHIPPVDPGISIEVLIGRDVIQAHHVLDQRVGGDDVPYAQKLPLGWVILGETCLGKIHQTDEVCVNKTSVLVDGRTSCFRPCENTLVVKPYSVFKKTPQDETLAPSIEDEFFLKLMDAELTLDAEGHWSAPLPFRKSRPALPNNRVQALQRAKSLDRSLQRDTVKREHVFDFMQKMIDKGHAEKAPPLSPEVECWYLPFFGIYHPKKPGSIRVVFDSSAKFNGISLNEVLMKGPDLTNNLLGVLLRFRKESIAITADVEQMFYNFKVEKSHRNYLRFVWHEDNDISRPLVDYRMTVHVFGNSPSPAIATYALRKSVMNADEDVQDFVRNNFYVDDGLVSCSDEFTAIDLMKRSQTALANGGRLRLHKIVSNSNVVLESFDTEDLSKDLKNLDLGSDMPPMQRSLGLTWDISTDQLVFQTSPVSKPFTRRGVLSTINSLFDPIGFAAPVTLRGKLLLRELMSNSGTLTWDAELPKHIDHKWNDWVTSLECLSEIRIPLRFSDISYEQATRKEVHIFSDASKDGIASVAYLKLFYENTSDISFLLGKAKVAPPQGHTIPRLELCAAVLSVELADIIKEHLELDSGSFYFYTDSQVVLGYIANETRRFYVYVANRVSRIRASSSVHQWHFVSTDENPADIAPRGANPSELLKTAYFRGPAFLRDVTSAPVDKFQLVEPDKDKEVRPVIQTVKTNLCDFSTWTDRIARFSSWDSLIRALRLLKGKIRKRHNLDPPSRLDVEQFVIRTVQHEVYSSEIKAVRAGKQWPVNSNISPLSPFLDTQHIVRVGGRLKNARQSQYFQPIIVPKKHNVSVLLVRHYHSVTSHQGRHLTEGALRSAGYWVIGSKRLIASIIRQCVTCKKLRGQFCTQRMADLPEERLQPCPPFTFVGVDAFGPWPVVFRKTRGGGANQKRWALLFTCLVSRAIHIEVIEELSSASFINAFRRFVALRGAVKLMRSDRGTNFVGSVEELGIQSEFVENGSVDKALVQHGTTWKFNPPHASHFGGSWERMIGVCRRILENMLLQERNKLTHEVLTTLMAEVCAIVNSRPLLPVSSDPECPDILSPSLLLTHKSPQESYSFPQFGTKDMLRSQWKLVQALANEFWSKWSKEYTHTLQTRRKWETHSRNLKPGDVVLMRDRECHRLQWPLAIVERVFPSEDNRVRKVEIRTVNKDKRATYIRPVVELVSLVETD